MAASCIELDDQALTHTRTRTLTPHLTLALTLRSSLAPNLT